jgi:hypothetical protein
MLLFYIIKSTRGINLIIGAEMPEIENNLGAQATTPADDAPCAIVGWPWQKAHTWQNTT